MKINLFKVANADPSISMHKYGNKLFDNLIKIDGLEVNEVKMGLSYSNSLQGIIAREVIYPLQAHGLTGDVNHIVDHSYGNLAYFLDPQKTVVTCHDLNAIYFPRQSSFFGRKRFIYNVRGMLRCGYIIADSESTKKEIEKRFKYRGLIKVVYLGVDEEFGLIRNLDKEKILNKFKLPKNKQFILHTSGSKPVKNIPILIDVISQLGKNSHLIKVGKFTSEQKELIQAKKLEDRIHEIGRISQEELVEMYNMADLLIVPSIAEGFGFPVLEAMKCGCPVICADNTSLPEVGGQAALYCQTYDISSYVKNINLVLSDRHLKKKMIDLGLVQAGKFSWLKTAREVSKIYHLIYEKNS